MLTPTLGVLISSWNDAALGLVRAQASTEGDSSTSSVVLGALAGIGGVVVAALVTQAWTQQRERAARLAESQRSALHDFQDATFELRQAYRRYARTPDPTPKQVWALDRQPAWLTLVECECSMTFHASSTRPGSAPPTIAPRWPEFPNRGFGVARLQLPHRKGAEELAVTRPSRHRRRPRD